MDLARKFLSKVYEEELKFLKDMLTNENYRDYLYVGPLSLEEIIQKFEHHYKEISDEASLDEMEIENSEFKRHVENLENAIKEERIEEIKLAYNAITQILIFDGDDFIFTDYMQRSRTVRDDSGYKTKKEDLINFVLGKDNNAEKIKKLLNQDETPKPGKRH